MLLILIAGGDMLGKNQVCAN